MKQEDKELLLKDLCARLPYGIKASYSYFYEMTIKSINVYHITAELVNEGHKFAAVPIEDFKPYLRPMSNIASLISAKEWSSLGGIELIDFYNSNHIDYRGLIEKGLAIEAPKGMYRKFK